MHYLPISLFQVLNPKPNDIPNSLVQNIFCDIFRKEVYPSLLVWCDSPDSQFENNSHTFFHCTDVSYGHTPNKSTILQGTH